MKEREEERNVKNGFRAAEMSILGQIERYLGGGERKEGRAVKREFGELGHCLRLEIPETNLSRIQKFVFASWRNFTTLLEVTLKVGMLTFIPIDY